MTYNVFGGTLNLTQTIFSIHKRPDQSRSKLQRCSQEGSVKNGTHMGRGGGSSPQQIRLKSGFGVWSSPPHGRGLNQRQGQCLVTPFFRFNHFP